MRLVKRAICVLVVIFVIMACVPMSAFATGDVIEFTEAAKLGASIVDLYGMANNTSLAYDVASNQSALTVIENLYTEYSSNASDPYTLAAIGAAAAAAGAIAVIYDAVTGQGYIQLYQEQYISSLDGYWDYQLADVGLVRDSVSNLFTWSLNQQDTVTPIQIYTDAPFANQPIPIVSDISNPQVAYNNSQLFGIGTGNYSGKYLAISGRSSADFYVFYVGAQYIIASPTSDVTYNFITDENGTYNIRDASTSNYFSSKNLYYSNRFYWNLGTILAPVYSSIDAGLNDLALYLGGSVDYSSVSLEPYWGDPLDQPLEITIPDNTSPDYTPVPRRITTTMPIPEGVEIPLPDGVDTPEYGVPYPVTDPASLNAIVPELWDNLVADDVDLREAPDPAPDPGPVPDPSEVFVPLLPVTLPSFNFNFAGIWHYVRDWVSSLGAWFTMVFTVWSNLPYAIVVPVYATAVIVIVLGVYKRFFM